MKPLSGLDAAFLYAETASTPMNVVAVVLVEGEVETAALTQRIGERLDALPVFRRRPVTLPLDLGHPVWVEDPELDLRNHIRRVAAPPPGDAAALETVVGGLANTRLDRSRPLFEITVVDGLADGCTALVAKVHHAALDGVSGAGALLHLFDRPDASDPGMPAARPGSHAAAGHGGIEPDARTLLREGLRHVGAAPGRARRAAGDVARSAWQLGRDYLAAGAPLRDAVFPFQAPESSLNGRLSRRRVVAYARTPLERVQRVRAAFGGTLNDVVLAACTRALRAELLARGEPVRGPLVAGVPVSTRGVGEAPDCGNRISALLARLPVQLEDPLHALSDVKRAARAAKRFHADLGGGTLASLAELLPPGLAPRLFDAYGRFGGPTAHRPLCNVLISNVPGPAAPLQLLGRPVSALHPHGPLMEGVGVNVTVMSYAGSVDVGVLACPERLPAAQRLAEGVAVAVEELDKLAEAALPEVPPMARSVA